jgi:hypothetical protein
MALRAQMEAGSFTAANHRGLGLVRLGLDLSPIRLAPVCSRQDPGRIHPVRHLDPVLGRSHRDRRRDRDRIHPARRPVRHPDLVLGPVRIRPDRRRRLHLLRAIGVAAGTSIPLPLP